MHMVCFRFCFCFMAYLWDTSTSDEQEDSHKLYSVRVFSFFFNYIQTVGLQVFKNKKGIKTHLDDPLKIRVNRRQPICV